MALFLGCFYQLDLFSELYQDLGHRRELPKIMPLHLFMYCADAFRTMFGSKFRQSPLYCQSNPKVHRAAGLLIGAYSNYMLSPA